MKKIYLIPLVLILFTVCTKEAEIKTETVSEPPKSKDNIIITEKQIDEYPTIKLGR